jgi:2-polyprenyl-3-methyl-5-hydroxy-6-metoxy-1,4-benzoquinol methylase
MKKILKHINKCRSCYSSKLIKVYHNNPSPIGESFLEKKNINLSTNKKYPLNLMICSNCKFAQLDNIVDSDVVYKDYLYTTTSSPGLIDHFKKASSVIISKLKLKKNSKILDIGSNDGSLLSFFKKKGHDVLGVEPAGPASKLSKLKGINTIVSFFDNDLVKKINLTHGKFDLILANNVFANIDDINSWILNIKNLLDDNGSFVFESSYLLDVVKNQVFDFIYHEHLSYFSMTSVQNLCKRHGLFLFDYDHISTKGGSIRYYISKNRNISKKVYKLIDKEKKFKLFNKETYKKLKIKINDAKKNIQNFIKSKNNLIGFGASISCITLIYEFNLENKFSILVDDNKIKENKFSPGSQIKVLSPKKISITKKDIILILPWRFQKKIIKKHKSLLKKAGSVIQVWPKFKKMKL